MRTWEENRSAINQLWPQCQWTDEERRLWKDDLSSLDQAVLYDAVRNVKRTKETLYPQLKWVLEEHRDLMRARKRASAKPASQDVKIDLSGIRDEEDGKLHDDFKNPRVLSKKTSSPKNQDYTAYFDDFPKPS